MIDLVKVDNGNQLRTTSRIVAKVFGKSHMHVMRAIRNLPTPEDFNVSNFGLIDFKDDKGRTYQEYTMTRDGFMFLVMGFTGKSAVEYKLKFIDAFNKMEAQLLKQQDGLEWKVARTQLKMVRHSFTDVVKEFVEYATKQGSQSASKYYGSLTKMEYAALELVDWSNKVPDNFRNTLDMLELSYLTAAEQVARQALKVGMENEMHYKDIYQYAKQAVLKYAEGIKLPRIE